MDPYRYKAACGRLIVKNANAATELIDPPSASSFFIATIPPLIEFWIRDPAKVQNYTITLATAKTPSQNQDAQISKKPWRLGNCCDCCVGMPFGKPPIKVVYLHPPTFD
jgi:hypothetical protein